MHSDCTLLGTLISNKVTSVCMKYLLICTASSCFLILLVVMLVLFGT